MSFIILILIIFMLYTSLAKYSSIFKTVFMILLLFSITGAFIAYGRTVFMNSDVFVILNTSMSLSNFIHVCVIWLIADFLVMNKIIRNYKNYLSVNEMIANISEQEQV